MRFLLIFTSFLLLSQTALGQKKDRFPSYFGFQFKPLIPGDFLAKSQITVSNGTFSGTFTQKYGYSFGAMARIGFTKLLSFETGINQVKRNYDIDFSYPDSSLYGSSDFGVISYDIPFNAMIYIQLSEKFFTNASLGTSFVYYPSNVGVILPVDNKVTFSAEGKRNRRFDFEINANFGFELRTEKNGFFYLGASAKLPFAPIFKVASVYEFPGNQSVAAVGQVNGAYLSLDLRYFFPTVKSKGKNTPDGPIKD
ncbi:MAG: hypothetical protein ACO1O6_14165 [Bacteroidota bacterium]